MEKYKFKKIAILSDESKKLVFKRRMKPLIDVGKNLNLQFVLYDNKTNLDDVDVLIVQSIPKSLKILNTITNGSHILIYDIPDYMGVILDNRFIYKSLNLIKRLVKSVITFKIHPYIILSKLVNSSDLIFTGSFLQAEFFRKNFNKKTYDLVDPVNDSEYSGAKAKHKRTDKIKIIWDGTEPSFMHFNSIIKPLFDVYKTRKFELIILTDEFKKMKSKLLYEKLKKHITIKHVHWSQDNFNKVLSSSDIAIAPIDKKDIFNFSKPSNKLISYWAFGLPVICSDIPSYRLISTTDKSFCCQNENDWINSLKLLIDNHNLRNKMGEIAYNFSWSQHSKEVFSKKYFNKINELF